jgi:hypothetical protein
LCLLFCADLKAKCAILAISSSEYSHKSEAIVPDSFNFSLQNKPPVNSQNNKISTFNNFFKGEESNNVEYGFIGLIFAKDLILFSISTILLSVALCFWIIVILWVTDSSKQHCICINTQV